METTMSLEALTQALGVSAGTISVEEQEINIELNIESDEDGVPVDTTEAPEAQILDAQEEENELDATAEAQEELEEAHEALEALAISIESYKANGGLTSQLAEEKYQQLDLITRKWGSLRSSCPSVESFGIESSQLDQTISLENTVVEAIKRFWQTIVSTVSGWIESFRTWIAKTFNVGTRLKKRAEKLKKSLGDMKTDPSSKQAEGSVAAGVYMASGKVTEGAAQTKAVLDIALGKAVDAYKTFASSAQAGTVAAAEKVGDKDGALDISGITSVYKLYQGLTTSNSLPVPNMPGVKYRISKPLPGGRVFAVTDVSAPSSFASDVQGVGAAKKWVNTIKADLILGVSKEKVKSAKVNFLSASECGVVIDNVVAIATLVENFKNKFADREKVGKEITEFAKKQATATKEAEGKNGALVKANIQIAQTLWSRVSQIDKAAVSAGLTISNSLLNFVSASVAKGKREEKAEPAKA